MDDLEIFMETKKYVESVLGNDKVDFNDSVIEQIAELYLEKLASSNINISNVMVDDLVKNEDLKQIEEDWKYINANPELESALHFQIMNHQLI